MPTRTRDKARTRAALLDAAERLLAERGTAASLIDIATEAGVTKSGLLHHFSSKDDLLLAVADRSMQMLIDDVMEGIEPDDGAPGKLARAYVQALCGGSERAMAIFSPVAMVNALISVPGIEVLLERDAAFWRQAFLDDGLDEQRWLVVRHAAEGIAAASAVTSYLTDEERTLARDALLQLASPTDATSTSAHSL